MCSIAIKAEAIGKKYHLGNQARYYTLRDAITQLAAARPFGRNSLADENTVWAIQDVSFEIKHGEAVGIIGRNGAGKSTLLKILSRITEPSQGCARIRGRVGPLLEVGTGFHPELTGRENIYLSGAILGLRRAEIDRAFDDIVAFAEVERFVDTPVKHYSSGMYVRLAFAVAASLEPEILLVDEVLAVGDAEFQKKCLGRMKKVAGEGRTILFVSHNMSSIAHLCERGLLLEGGRLVQDGEIGSVIDAYLNSGPNGQSEVVFPDNPSKSVQVTKLQIIDYRGRSTLELDRAKPFCLVADIFAWERLRGTLIFALDTAHGVRVCKSVCADVLEQYTYFEANETKRFRISVPPGLLNEGLFKAVVWVVPGNTGVFDFVESPIFGLVDLTGRASFFGERKKDTSILRIDVNWKILDSDTEAH